MAMAIHFIFTILDLAIRLKSGHSFFCHSFAWSRYQASKDEDGLPMWTTDQNLSSISGSDSDDGPLKILKCGRRWTEVDGGNEVRPWTPDQYSKIKFNSLFQVQKI